jgi:hypothetical protein
MLLDVIRVHQRFILAVTEQTPELCLSVK